MDAFKIYISGLKQCIPLGSCLIQTILFIMNLFQDYFFKSCERRKLQFRFYLNYYKVYTGAGEYNGETYLTGCKKRWSCFFLGNTLCHH